MLFTKKSYDLQLGVVKSIVISYIYTSIVVLRVVYLWVYEYVWHSRGVIFFLEDACSTELIIIIFVIKYVWPGAIAVVAKSERNESFSSRNSQHNIMYYSVIRRTQKLNYSHWFREKTNENKNTKITIQKMQHQITINRWCLRGYFTAAGYVTQ